MFLQRCLLLLLFFGVEGYKFLVYSPLYGHSHSTFMGRIADVLHEAGHEVTVLLPVINENYVRMTGVKSKAKQILLEQEPRTKVLMEYNRKGFMKDFWTMEYHTLGWLSTISNWSLCFEYTCEGLIRNETLLQYLQSEKFDVGIAEPKSYCGFGLFKHLGIASTITAVSNVHVEAVSRIFGEPFPTSYVPSTFSAYGEEMTIFQRLKNTIDSLSAAYFVEHVFNGEARALAEKFGEDYADYQTIIGDSSIVFTNSNPLLDFPRPILSKTISIGGISVNWRNTEKLEKKWDEILNKRPKNVLISFGSVVKSKDMPDAWKTSILETCSSMPNVTFIWKYEEESNFADNVPNVVISPWLPQNALLSDPRLSLFVTHGGLGSTTELAYFGKPAIMIPLFGDQSRNAAMLSRNGGALVLQKTDLGNSETLRNTLLEMLNNDRYSNSALRLSEMLRQQPISPKELLIYHSEFVAKFGPLSQLDHYGRHLNIFQYYLVDVMLVVLFGAVVLLLIPWLTLRYFFKKVF